MILTFFDVETANRERSSICSIGISVQENGLEIDNFYSLVKPTPFNIEPICKRVHGIDYCDLKDAPTFTDIYGEIERRLKGIVIAHNAAFDMDCLSTLLFKLGMPFPSFEYLDSLEVARARFEHPKLEMLADFYGIENYNAHNALADARALGAVYWKMREDFTPEFCRSFLNNFEDRYEIEVKQDFDDNFSEKEHVKDVEHTESGLPFQCPNEILFDGKNFVITGEFEFATRERAEMLILRRGGRLQTMPNKKTNYIVVGKIASSNWAHGNYGRKIEKALTLDNVIFISEKTFLGALEKTRTPFNEEIDCPKHNDLTSSHILYL